MQYEFYVTQARDPAGGSPQVPLPPLMRRYVRILSRISRGFQILKSIEVLRGRLAGALEILYSTCPIRRRRRSRPKLSESE
jgi:hypothetical protein